MKLSVFLSISKGFASPIQFLDFWTESDVFAIRIQRSLPSDKGAAFWKDYNNVRQAMEFYQDSGPCDYFMQDPSYDRIEEKAFGKHLSVAQNTENLVNNIDAWLNSEFKNTFLRI